MAVTFAPNINLGDVLSKINFHPGKFFKNREVIRAYVRHCIKAFPGYNVLVSINLDLAVELKDFQHSEKTLVGMLGSEYKVDVYVFKSGIITNIRNKKGDDHWGYNANIDYKYGTKDRVYVFREKPENFHDDIYHD